MTIVISEENGDQNKLIGKKRAGEKELMQRTEENFWNSEDYPQRYLRNYYVHQKPGCYIKGESGFQERIDRNLRRNGKILKIFLEIIFI